MSTGNILKSLRESACMTQAHLAEKVHVTRQAVSRWENGETTPGPDILVSLSMIFGVSVDALLESPEIRYCECCGMPLETGIMGHDKGGNLDPRYCKWCMDQGEFAYTDLDQMLDFLVTHMPQEGLSADECRSFYRNHLLQLPYWKEKEEMAASQAK
ncbi:zinc ribbon domain-containing protein [uncultured Faecalibaculum sp.]|uniref:zinc ribbon domain-containing protein n=1 Tax=uncultured Faecalibaculum sp. TaxID=1729681 RepID=UPI00260C8D8E|nr:zinc ribbon domain-containing protein [uncultured Faecalibaculum sp.]